MRFRAMTLCALSLGAMVCVGVACGGDDDGGGGGHPAGTRIPGCVTEDGIDLYAAEGDGVLGLTWNNIGGADFSGGYRVRIGTGAGDYDEERAIPCTTIDCETVVDGLENDVTYYVVVDALDGDGHVSDTSCEVAASPRALWFLEDLRVNDGADGVQATPSVAAAWDGLPLLLAWEDAGTVVLSRSDDLGDTWSLPEPAWGTSGAEASPSLFFRRREVATDPETGEEVVLVTPAVLLAFEAGGEVLVMRGEFPDGHAGDLVLGDAVSLGPGILPRVTAVEEHVEVAFEDGAAIFAARSSDGGLTFGAAEQVDTGGGESYRPSVAVDPLTHDVYVAYHGRRGAGDTDIYLNVSADGGLTFGAAEVRVDDDSQGQNQRSVSLAVDGRTGQVLATWEDRRGGADIYFTRSFDGGLTFEPNLQTGAGLQGDQFEPQAVVDPGRNVYVVFVDTSDGRRPLFSRFNPEGTFDPPLPVSAAAGQAGAAASEPAVTVDEYGTVYVTWIENRAGAEVDVYFTRAE